jgi:iojap-like ribosome-associated protein
MNILKNIDSIIDILKENKAIDILKIDVKKLTSTVDFMVIASGTSSRHIRGLSEIAMAEAKKNNLLSIGVEGQDGSDWI